MTKVSKQENKSFHEKRSTIGSTTFDTRRQPTFFPSLVRGQIEEPKEPMAMRPRTTEKPNAVTVGRSSPLTIRETTEYSHLVRKVPIHSGPTQIDPINHSVQCGVAPLRSSAASSSRYDKKIDDSHQPSSTNSRMITRAHETVSETTNEAKTTSTRVVERKVVVPRRIQIEDTFERYEIVEDVKHRERIIEEPLLVEEDCGKTNVEVQPQKLEVRRKEQQNPPAQWERKKPYRQKKKRHAPLVEDVTSIVKRDKYEGVNVERIVEVPEIHQSTVMTKVPYIIEHQEIEYVDHYVCKALVNQSGIKLKTNYKSCCVLP